MKETDLFQPICDHFQQKGYEIAAEVAGCDVVAKKNEELVIIELKKSLNLTLISQAVDRQKITDLVYVAFFAPKRSTRSFRTSKSILDRLGLGLITVSKTPLRMSAAILKHPSRQLEIDLKRRSAFLKELAGRSIQPNIGGSTGIPVYTAYRETAITIAMLLESKGPLKVSEVRPMCGDKVQSILAQNHYGWFQRIERGIYDLTDGGRTALVQYPELRGLVNKLIVSS